MKQFFKVYSIYGAYSYCSNKWHYNKEDIPFITAFNRYSTQLFYISKISDLESINMTDKYSYELMVNIMNDYLMILRI